jgi:hypothetical protein
MPTDPKNPSTTATPAFDDEFSTVNHSAGSDIFEFDCLPSDQGQIADFTSSADPRHPSFRVAGYAGAEDYLSFVSESTDGTNICFDPVGRLATNPWPFLITKLDHASQTARINWFLH